MFRSLQACLTAKARVSVVATSAAVSALASALAISAGSLPGMGRPALAQAAAAKPASMELMNDMALAAAVNVCELVVESKIPVEKAVLSNAKAITYVVTNRYGGQVANAGKLQPEQIANGTIIQVVGRVRQGCYNRLGAADKKFVDEVLSEYSKAVDSKK
ncbi:hypothetical protein [Cyanobium sp. NIES-981]|uniref:hypothetical protein n=1 Tax=Cyanobium sp. NIES-981 TaxID=1851505 RepID=UPI000B34B4CB|nr:hypothetical protein [Cyanobium sp. NIES-981]